MIIPAMLIRMLHLAFRLAVSLVVIVACAWSAGAIYYDSPFAPGVRAAIALTWLVVALTLWFITRRRPKARALVILGFTVIIAWWFTLQPRSDRPWQANVSETPWAEVNGDKVTLHNVRNCDYRTDSDFTVRWETRVLDLTHLTGLDISLTNWGSPWMAHPIICFEFSDAPPLALSIETRKEQGESYSAIGGLYRQFELMIVAADERDLLRLRTNYRRGETVCLYRSTMTLPEARERFLQYVKTMNDLHERPRWYNAVTTNCTTAIRTQHDASKRMAWDWRILFNGKLDELCYERGVIATDGLSFQELKSRALINPAAMAADHSPDFSRDIRKDRPGFKM